MKSLTKISGLILLLFLQIINAQKISMYFPAFAGKTYDFVLFLGSKTNVQKGTIPSDGRFILEIPKEYAPYKGMSRWLITNTQEGGGLDMIVPGKDFSVECLVKIPSEKDIVYKGNTENKALDSLYKSQKNIIDKFSIMSQAIKIYSATDKNYNIYNEEYNKQLDNYNSFRENLFRTSSYTSKFLIISNLTTGTGTSPIVADEITKAKDAGSYITKDLDWQILYTSGHWETIIKAWVDIQTTFEDPDTLLKNFITISNKLQNPEMYISYVERVTHTLTELGKDNIIEKLAPAVLSSQKITDFTGILSVYKNTVSGSHAPDLIVSDQTGSVQTLKSSDFASGNYEKTLLIFYQWGCGHCESVLNEISNHFDLLEKKKIKVIAISGDTDLKVFKDSSSKFKWKDSYCDQQGTNGVNFKNYSVSGTPTLFLLDKKGIIITRKADSEFIIKNDK